MSLHNVSSGSNSNSVSDDDDEIKCNACGFEASFVPEGMIACERCQAVSYCSLKCKQWDWKRGGHVNACCQQPVKVTGTTKQQQQQTDDAPIKIFPPQKEQVNIDLPVSVKQRTAALLLEQSSSNDNNQTNSSHGDESSVESDTTENHHRNQQQYDDESDHAEFYNDPDEDGDFSGSSMDNSDGCGSMDGEYNDFSSRTEDTEVLASIPDNTHHSTVVGNGQHAALLQRGSYSQTQQQQLHDDDEDDDDDEVSFSAPEPNETIGSFHEIRTIDRQEQHKVTQTPDTNNNNTMSSKDSTRNSLLEQQTTSESDNNTNDDDESDHDQFSQGDDDDHSMNNHDEGSQGGGDDHDHSGSTNYDQGSMDAEYNTSDLSSRTEDTELLASIPDSTHHSNTASSSAQKAREAAAMLQQSYSNTTEGDDDVSFSAPEPNQTVSGSLLGTTGNNQQQQKPSKTLLPTSYHAKNNSESSKQKTTFQEPDPHDKKLPSVDRRSSTGSSSTCSSSSAINNTKTSSETKKLAAFRKHYHKSGSDEQVVQERSRSLKDFRGIYDDEISVDSQSLHFTSGDESIKPTPMRSVLEEQPESEKVTQPSQNLALTKSINQALREYETIYGSEAAQDVILKLTTDSGPESQEELVVSLQQQPETDSELAVPKTSESDKEPSMASAPPASTGSAASNTSTRPGGGMGSLAGLGSLGKQKGKTKNAPLPRSTAKSSYALPSFMATSNHKDNDESGSSEAGSVATFTLDAIVPRELRNEGIHVNPSERKHDNDNDEESTSSGSSSSSGDSVESSASTFTLDAIVPKHLRSEGVHVNPLKKHHDAADLSDSLNNSDQLEKNGKFITSAERKPPVLSLDEMLSATGVGPSFAGTKSGGTSTENTHQSEGEETNSQSISEEDDSNSESSSENPTSAALLKQAVASIAVRHTRSESSETTEKKGSLHGAPASSNQPLLTYRKPLEQPHSKTPAPLSAALTNYVECVMTSAQSSNSQDGSAPFLETETMQTTAQTISNQPKLLSTDRAETAIPGPVIQSTLDKHSASDEKIRAITGYDSYRTRLQKRMMQASQQNSDLSTLSTEQSLEAKLNLADEERRKLNGVKAVKTTLEEAPADILKTSHENLSKSSIISLGHSYPAEEAVKSLPDGGSYEPILKDRDMSKGLNIDAIKANGEKKTVEAQRQQASILPPVNSVSELSQHLASAPKPTSELPDFVKSRTSIGMPTNQVAASFTPDRTLYDLEGNEIVVVTPSAASKQSAEKKGTRYEIYRDILSTSNAFSVRKLPINSRAMPETLISVIRDMEYSEGKAPQSREPHDEDQHVTQTLDSHPSAEADGYSNPPQAQSDGHPSVSAAESAESHAEKDFEALTLPKAVAVSGSHPLDNVHIPINEGSSEINAVDETRERGAGLQSKEQQQEPVATDFGANEILAKSLESSLPSESSTAQDQSNLQLGRVSMDASSVSSEKKIPNSTDREVVQARQGQEKQTALSQQVSPTDTKIDEAPSGDNQEIVAARAAVANATSATATTPSLGSSYKDQLLKAFGPSTTPRPHYVSYRARLQNSSKYPHISSAGSVISVMSEYSINRAEMAPGESLAEHPSKRATGARNVIGKPSALKAVSRIIPFNEEDSDGSLKQDTQSKKAAVKDDTNVEKGGITPKKQSSKATISSSTSKTDRAPHSRVNSADKKEEDTDRGYRERSEAHSQEEQSSRRRLQTLRQRFSQLLPRTAPPR